MRLDPQRFFPADPAQRKIASELFGTIEKLPIISPHGHTDPAWFARDEAFSNPTALFIQPDHYIFRMLYSQGISLESLGIPQLDGKQQAKALLNILQQNVTQYETAFGEIKLEPHAEGGIVQ